jgi:hypothetical protein
MRNTESHIRGPIEALAFTEGAFAGIIFSYSKVQLLEDKKNDRLALKFDYDIIENPLEEFDVEAFEQELGEHLSDLLREGVQKNSIIYTGGT